MAALHQGGASASPVFTPAALAVWMEGAGLTPTEREAVDDLCHNLDLIGCFPRSYEVEWALARAREVRA